MLVYGPFLFGIKITHIYLRICFFQKSVQSNERRPGRGIVGAALPVVPGAAPSQALASSHAGVVTAGLLFPLCGCCVGVGGALGPKLRILALDLFSSGVVSAVQLCSVKSPLMFIGGAEARGGLQECKGRPATAFLRTVPSCWARGKSQEHVVWGLCLRRDGERQQRCHIRLSRLG